MTLYVRTPIASGTWLARILSGVLSVTVTPLLIEDGWISLKIETKSTWLTLILVFLLLQIYEEFLFNQLNSIYHVKIRTLPR